jgi:hypothetical protein
MFLVDIETAEWKAVEAQAGDMTAAQTGPDVYKVDGKVVTIDGKLIDCSCIREAAYCEHMPVAWAEHLRRLQAFYLAQVAQAG